MLGHLIMTFYWRTSLVVAIDAATDSDIVATDSANVVEPSTVNPATPTTTVTTLAAPVVPTTATIPDLLADTTPAVVN